MRAYALKTGAEPQPQSFTLSCANKTGPPRLSIVVLPFANIAKNRSRNTSSMVSVKADHRSVAHLRLIRNWTQHCIHLQGKTRRSEADRERAECALRSGGQRQRSGNRLRVNVQLIDAESGAHLWAERFDKPVADSSTCRTRSWRGSPISSGQSFISTEARRSERAPSSDSLTSCFKVWLGKQRADI